MKRSGVGAACNSPTPGKTCFGGSTIMSVTTLAPSAKPKARKPRQRRPHERSVAVVIRPSAGQPDAYVRITQDGEASHSWLSALPSDFGRAFRLAKPGHEGTDSYDVLLDAAGDSCTCPGHTYGGFCKHVD